MEKSQEQLKHIQRTSCQTRHHRIYLNKIYDQNLRTQLNQLAVEREQTLIRSAIRRELEEERKQVLKITVKQIAREREPRPRPRPLPINTIHTEEESVQSLAEKNESRPTSSVQLPSTERSCRLFSHNCRLYPCQPVYQYTSFIKKEHDQILEKRNSPSNSFADSSDKSHLQEIFRTVEEKKHQQHRRQLASAVHNQQYQTNRHISMERRMTILDEQSRTLHQRLAEKKPFGYMKERQKQLSQTIQRHLNITAKFCA